MLARKQTSIKVDPEAWDAAKEIFEAYNLTVSDGINIFLNKVRLEKGLPFDMKLTNHINHDYMQELKNRHLKIDKDISIDEIINEINDGLS